MFLCTSLDEIWNQGRLYSRITYRPLAEASRNDTNIKGEFATPEKNDHHQLDNIILIIEIIKILIQTFVTQKPHSHYQPQFPKHLNILRLQLTRKSTISIMNYHVNYYDLRLTYLVTTSLAEWSRLRSRFDPRVEQSIIELSNFNILSNGMEYDVVSCVKLSQQK